MLTIGEMSRQTLLSARALRHYDAVGLLSPASIDERTGYRHYAPEQIAVAARIRRLREVGMALDDVRRVLDDPAALATALRSRRDALVRQVAADRRTLVAIDRWLDNEGAGMFECTIKTLPPESVAMFRWRGSSSDADMVSAEPWITLTNAVHAVGGRAEGTVGVGNVFELDGIADLDLGFVTEELLPPADGYVSRVLDGGEFVATRFAQWADKAAAYEALWGWVVANGHKPRGPIRERAPLIRGMEMIALPNATVVDADPTGWPTEILLPIYTSPV